MTSREQWSRGTKCGPQPVRSSYLYLKGGLYLKAGIIVLSRAADLESKESPQ